MWACLTIQQVSGAQVDVDAGVEARDEAVESSFLHTLTLDGRTDRGTAVRRLLGGATAETCAYLPASCGRSWL